MSFRKYLRLARTRRYKEILSGGFESNKTGMCDLACKIICPVLSFCYYFQMWNSHSSKILQVKLGQEKTMASAIKGTPMGAARRRASGASGQHCMLRGHGDTFLPVPCHQGRTSTWAGAHHSQPFSASRCTASAKKEPSFWLRCSEM